MKPVNITLHWRWYSRIGGYTDRIVEFQDWVYQQDMVRFNQISTHTTQTNQYH